MDTHVRIRETPDGHAFIPGEAGINHVREWPLPLPVAVTFRDLREAKLAVEEAILCAALAYIEFDDIQQGFAEGSWALNESVHADPRDCQREWPCRMKEQQAARRRLVKTPRGSRR